MRISEPRRGKGIDASDDRVLFVVGVTFLDLTAGDMTCDDATRTCDKDGKLHSRPDLTDRVL